MENRESLTERFAALQDRLMTIYESDPKDLVSQIEHWDLVKKENEYLYYTRKEGNTHLGLFPAPALQVSENNAKQAIQMGLLLRSLAKSEYSKESWSLTETSAHLVLQTEPKQCFKKGPFQIEVWFDNDPDKALPYPCWDWIYYLDSNDKWQKVQGTADYNGIYYEEKNGDRAYFTIFDTDAIKYGTSGQWTVKIKNKTISASVTSSSRSSKDSSRRVHDTVDPGPSTQVPGRQEKRDRCPSERRPATSTSDLSPRRRRGRGEQGELPSTTSRRDKRRRTDSGGPPSPGAVGQTHHTPERRHLSRLGVLQAEARDPYIALVQGQANNLKCWRRRVSQKYRNLYLVSSTIWNWVGDDSEKNSRSRMLYAFSSIGQRNMFVQTVNPPKGASIVFGNLDNL
uniref:Regulatory protein E2 n=1 Tax=Human papillomavirus TaxID=10566 RepID=A0A385PM36_9PAPI|nr:MAG: E2 protein [Human papillomavirus]